jgi:hypothetical protein
LLLLLYVISLFVSSLIPMYYVHIVGSNAGKRQRWSMNDFSKIRHLIATGQIDNTTTPEMVMDLLNIGDDKYDLAQVRDALAFIRLVEQSSNINMNNVTLLNDNSNNQKDRKSKYCCKHTFISI